MVRRPENPVKNRMVSKAIVASDVDVAWQTSIPNFSSSQNSPRALVRVDLRGRANVRTEVGRLVRRPPAGRFRTWLLAFPDPADDARPAAAESIVH